MAQRTKVCDRCGTTGLIWKNTGTARAPKWRLYIPDANGMPVREHPCQANPPAIAAIAAQVAAVQAATAEAADVPALDPAEIIRAAEDAKREAEAEDARIAAEQALAAAAAAAPYVATPIGHGNVPALDSVYMVDVEHLDAIRRVIQLVDATGRPQNIGLHGPAGSGKTTLGEQIAAIRQSPLFVFEMASAQTANEVYGTQTIDQGQIRFDPSELIKGIQTPGATVLINDVALLQSRTAQNGLNELLDPSSRTVNIPDYGTVTVAAGVIIVGTWNVGSEYTGASDLSEQILDRFRSGVMVEVPYPNATTMAKIIVGRTGCKRQDAEALANAAQWLRSDTEPINVSVRALIAAANQVMHGANCGRAIAFTVLGDRDAGEIGRAFGILSVKAPRVYSPPKLGTMQKLSIVSTAIRKGKGAA